METVIHLRRIEPYWLNRDFQPVDFYVQRTLKLYGDPMLSDALKHYTRGMYSLGGHYEAFSKYVRPVGLDELYWFKMLNNPHFREAMRLVTAELKPIFSVEPIASNQLDKIEWWSHTSAGFGYKGLKKDNYLLARHNATKALYQFEYFYPNYRFVPYRAFARTHLALRADPKIRHVWGVPFHSLLLEGCIAQPILKSCMLYDGPIYIGRDLIKDLPFSIVQMYNQSSGWLYCIDWSGFDASVNRGLLKWCFDLIGSSMDLKTIGDIWTFLYARDGFLDKYVAMPDGHLFLVTSGIPSGSFFTQLIGSICNLVIMYAIQLKFFGSVQRTYVLGDDSIFVSPEQSNLLPQIAEWIGSFGLKLNVTKSICTGNYSDLTFLGHNFYGSTVSRDDFTLLSMALYPEDVPTDAVASSVRVSSLLYDSGFNSFAMYNVLRHMLDMYNVRDHSLSSEGLRVYDTTVPFSRLFTL